MSLGQRAFIAFCVLLAIVAAGAAVALWPRPAKAETCEPHDAIVAYLTAAGEYKAAQGVTKDNDLMEVFVSPSGTWSILITEPGGDTCFYRVGNEWQGELKWQRASHHYTEPHSWISEHINNEGTGCCGPGDIAVVPHWEAAGVVVGSKVTADFPTHGKKTVVVNKVFPSRVSLAAR